MKFDEVINNRITHIKKTLASKGKEYARGNNRFHNFDRGAAITGQTPTKVLSGMMLKHLISVLDIVDDIDQGVWPTTDLKDEKIGDLINYLILLDGLIERQ